MKSTNFPVVPVVRALVHLSPLIKGGTSGTSHLHHLFHDKRDKSGQVGTSQSPSPYNPCSMAWDSPTQKGTFQGDEKLCKKRDLSLLCGDKSKHGQNGAERSRLQAGPIPGKILGRLTGLSIQRFSLENGEIDGFFDALGGCQKLEVIANKGVRNWAIMRRN